MKKLSFAPTIILKKQFPNFSIKEHNDLGNRHFLRGDKAES